MISLNTTSAFVDCFAILLKIQSQLVFAEPFRISVPLLLSSDQPFYFLFCLSCGLNSLRLQTIWYFTVVNESCNPIHDLNCLPVRVFRQQCVKTIFALYSCLKRFLDLLSFSFQFFARFCHHRCWPLVRV